jgi:hypothetical protein
MVKPGSVGTTAPGTVYLSPAFCGVGLLRRALGGAPAGLRLRQRGGLGERLARPHSVSREEPRANKFE